MINEMMHKCIMITQLIAPVFCCIVMQLLLANTAFLVQLIKNSNVKNVTGNFPTYGAIQA